MIDSGEDPAHRSQTLAEAARAERERRAHAGEPVAVITNKTLPHHAPIQRAQSKDKPASTATPQPPKPAATAEVRDEAYWRNRGLKIRLRWRKAADEIGPLEQSVADLRRRFYSEADPAVRDAQIKPAWDHTLELLQETREEANAARLELDEFLDEGRRGGALPGWLREGIEQEPTPRTPPPGPTQAIEPPVLKEGPP